MQHVTHTKRYRGTGLYRNHSRRRGDKESHIRELILQAEQEYSNSQTTDNTEKRTAAIEKALVHYETALSLIDAIHLPTQEAHDEQKRLRNTLTERIKMLKNV